MREKNYRLETLQLHVGQEKADSVTGARAVGTGDSQSTVRFSTGTENIEDILEDLELGFAALKR